ncbi:MAG: hypothetical protein JRG73_03825 [Deltaproteobacteria bacterium]|nr:hypothetical protein [Deltaproteobacteria bacterium]MBW2306042.1 hypothetical protein [Deltaproteobacteria bacterium]
MKTKTTESEKPSITEQGILIIPFESDPRYHWWNGGQSLDDTLRELQVNGDVIARYCPCCVREN